MRGPPSMSFCLSSDRGRRAISSLLEKRTRNRKETGYPNCCTRYCPGRNHITRHPRNSGGELDWLVGDGVARLLFAVALFDAPGFFSLLVHNRSVTSTNPTKQGIELPRTSTKTGLQPETIPPGCRQVDGHCWCVKWLTTLPFRRALFLHRFDLAIRNQCAPSSQRWVEESASDEVVRGDVVERWGQARDTVLLFLRFVRSTLRGVSHVRVSSSSPVADWHYSHHDVTRENCCK